MISDLLSYPLSFLRPRARSRISIFEKKPGVVWIIVADRQGETYSHHWTGSKWQTRSSEDYHVYTSRATAESYLRDDIRRMLGSLPWRRVTW